MKIEDGEKGVGKKIEEKKLYKKDKKKEFVERI